MKTQEKAEKLFAQAAERISPTSAEAEREKAFALKLVAKLEDALERENVRVYFVGSTARDTGLAGDKDVDLFVAFPQKHSREHVVEKAIAATKKSIAARWQMHYAEHPYLQAVVDGYKVEVIPCFQILPHEPVKSAVDRSPLHMDYLQKRLSPSQKRDVRLLKAMLKRTGVYGAEASIGGFSGLLCEYLVLNYRSLWNLLDNAAQWKPPIVIDIEAAWESSEEAVKKFAPSQLVLIDAIDKNRNAAAAVSAETLAVFSSMAQAFVKNPHEKFFSAEQKTPSTAVVSKAISSRGTFLYALQLPRPAEVVDDTLIPQARKALHSLKRLLAEEDFQVFDASLVFSEKQLFLLLELASDSRPGVELFLGPPAWLARDARQFAEKHANAVRGPFILGERIAAEEKRARTEASDFFKQLISSPKGVAVGKHLLPAWKRCQLLEGKKIIAAMDESEFKQLASFVFKKAFWL